MVVSKVPVSQARPRENLLQYCVAQATEEGGGGGTHIFKRASDRLTLSYQPAGKKKKTASHRRYKVHTL